MLCQTEQFVDVALPISDVHAALRIVQQFRGLSQVLQPASALFLFIGTRVGLIRRFRAFVQWNVSRFQNMIAARPSGRPSRVATGLECIRMPQLV